MLDNENIVDMEMQDAKVLELLTDAERYRQQQNYGAEARMLSWALKLKPEDTMIWNKLGRAYRAAGFLDKAVGCYKRVLELNPNDPWAYANLGAVCIAQEDFVAACDYYDRAKWLLDSLGSQSAKQNLRDYATVLGNYALALGKCGDKRQAAKMLKEAEKSGYANGAAVRKQLKLSIFDRLF